MLGTRFYNESFRKVLVAFGTLFNNIAIERDDGAGDKEIYKIPLSYGPRSKFNAILDSAGTHAATQMTIPRMGFEWTGTTYDPIRKLSTVVRQGVTTSGSGNTNASYNWQRVPYNMGFSLGVYVETTEDGLKIIWEDEWVHVRKSNTEPILRIISESKSISQSNKLIELIKQIIK